jgi:hypothetical protein
VHIALEKPATPATSLKRKALTCNKNRNKGATYPQHFRICPQFPQQETKKSKLGTGAGAHADVAQKTGNIGYTPHYQQLNRQQYRQQTGNNRLHC